MIYIYRERERGEGEREKKRQRENGNFFHMVYVWNIYAFKLSQKFKNVSSTDNFTKRWIRHDQKVFWVAPLISTDYRIVSLEVVVFVKFFFCKSKLRQPWFPWWNDLKKLKIIDVKKRNE